MTLTPRQSTRSTATFEALLPDALAAMARSLRAGSTLSVAAGEAAHNVGEPVAESLEQLGAGLASGKPLVQLLDAWTAAHPSTDSRLAAAVLSIGHVAGSGHARALLTAWPSRSAYANNIDARSTPPVPRSACRCCS